MEQLDKIVFIEDGRVEAVGPHDELYRSCAEYRRMVDLQKLEDEEGGGSMANVNPLLLVGAVIGVVTALLVLAYASSRTKRRRWTLSAR